MGNKNQFILILKHWDYQSVSNKKNWHLNNNTDSDE